MGFSFSFKSVNAGSDLDLGLCARMFKIVVTFSRCNLFTLSNNVSMLTKPRETVPLNNLSSELF